MGKSLDGKTLDLTGVYDEIFVALYGTTTNGTSYLFIDGTGNRTGNIADRQITVDRPQTFTFIRAKTGSGNTRDGTVTITLMKNGVDTGLTIQFAVAESAEKTILTNVDFNSGDTYNWKLATPGTTGSVTIMVVAGRMLR